MSWQGCELITVIFTPPCTTPSSSSRRAAPRAAQRPAKPAPSTTTSLIRPSLLFSEYLLGGLRVEQLELTEVGGHGGQRQRRGDRQFSPCPSGGSCPHTGSVGAQREH